MLIVVLLVKLALELAALSSSAYWAFQLVQHPVWRWVLAILTAALFVGIWATFIAPASATKLEMPWLVIAQLAIFALAALALWGAGHPALAIVFAALAIATEAVLVLSGSYSADGPIPPRE